MTKEKSVTSQEKTGVKKLKSGKKELDHKSRKDWSEKIEDGIERSQVRKSQKDARVSKKIKSNQES